MNTSTLFITVLLSLGQMQPPPNLNALELHESWKLFRKSEERTISYWQTHPLREGDPNKKLMISDRKSPLLGKRLTFRTKYDPELSTDQMLVAEMIGSHAYVMQLDDLSPQMGSRDRELEARYEQEMRFKPPNQEALQKIRDERSEIRRSFRKALYKYHHVLRLHLPKGFTFDSMRSKDIVDMGDGWRMVKGPEGWVQQPSYDGAGQIQPRRFEAVVVVRKVSWDNNAAVPILELDADLVYSYEVVLRQANLAGSPATAEPDGAD